MGWNFAVVYTILRMKATIGFLNQFEENVPMYEPIIKQDIFWAVQNTLKERRSIVGAKGMKWGYTEN